MTYSKSWIKVLLSESANLLKEVEQNPPTPPGDPLAGLDQSQPPQPDQQNQTGQELTVDTIVTALNNIRAGQALTEASVYQKLSDWWGKVPLTDRDILNRLLTQLSEIVSGDDKQNPEQAQQPPPSTQGPPAPPPSGGAPAATPPASPAPTPGV